MKNQLLPVAIVFILLATGLPAGHAATRPDIDPCGLIAREKVYAAYPVLKKMAKQTIGPNTTCNYLDKFGIAALMVSVHRGNGESAKGMISGFGEGYRLEPVAGLGQEAAMAVTLPVAKYNIAGDMVAALAVKESGSFLLLFPARIQTPVTGPGFERLKELAAAMLKKLKGK